MINAGAGFIHLKNAAKPETLDKRWLQPVTYISEIHRSYGILFYLTAVLFIVETVSGFMISLKDWSLEK